MAKKNGKFITTKDEKVAEQLENQGLVQLNSNNGTFIFINEPGFKLNFSEIKGKYSFTDTLHF